MLLSGVLRSMMSRHALRTTAQVGSGRLHKRTSAADLTGSGSPVIGPTLAPSVVASLMTVVRVATAVRRGHWPLAAHEAPSMSGGFCERLQSRYMVLGKGWAIHEMIPRSISAIWLSFADPRAAEESQDHSAYSFSALATRRQPPEALSTRRPLQLRSS